MKLAIGLYAATLFWLNAYICRDLFRVEYTGHMNSMHGFWAGMARLATSHWWRPGWWPYWDGGMPFEWTYAPLVPGLTALWSGLFGVSEARAFQSITALFYCLAPLTLFLMCVVLTRRPGWSFVTGAVYSLLAPTQLIVPDAPWAWQRLWDARRLYLMAVWDETPHMVALTLLPLVVMFTTLALRSGRTVYWVAAGLLMALSVLANAFGATMLLLGMIALVFASGRREAVRSIVLIGVTGAVAYLLICPALPPSLIRAIQVNAAANNDGFEIGGWTALSVVVLGGLVLLWALNRGRAEWWTRFVVMFAWLTTSIPVLYQYTGRHFFPQAGRYKIESEMALALLVVLGVKAILERVPMPVRVGVALVALSFGAEQVVAHRRFAKAVMQPADIRSTAEYRAARWAEANLRYGQARVAYPGSLGMWLNNFSDAHQWSGGSFATAYNRVQQDAFARWLAAGSNDGAADALVWMKAYGVQVFAVPGKQTTEFWKAMAKPEVYAGCEALWQQDDLRICRVPDAYRSLAHVVRGDLIVSRAETGAVRRYAAALTESGTAEFHWEGTNVARIRANLPVDGAVSVQVNHHPGWRATANGRDIDVRRDGLGLIALYPVCNGPCEIRLVYAGDWESWLCRLVSALAWVVGGGLIIRQR